MWPWTERGDNPVEFMSMIGLHDTRARMQRELRAEHYSLGLN